MSSLRIDKVSKSFGDFHAVKDISLDIADGEFLVLLGPSGCGKSTLLRMIAGLVPQSTGSFLIDERVVDDLPPRQRSVAFVFQSYALYPHMSVRRNVSFPLVMQGAKWYHHLPIVGSIRRRIIEKRPTVTEDVDRVVSALELEKLVDRYPRTLSGGQRQRVALARAMVRDPSLYLMDEPLSNLDAKLRVQMRAEISELHRRTGTTVVYVTHDQVEAMTMGTSVAVMLDGKIQQIGSPRDIYSRPANMFVAGFIGSPPMGFLKCAVVDGNLQLESGGVLPIPPGWNDALAGVAPGASLALGIRPEQLSVVDSGSPTGGEFSGTVVAREDLGLDELIRVRLDDIDDDEGLRSRFGAGGEALWARIPAESAHATVGTSVRLSVDVSALALFDAESEQRITP